MSGEAAQSRYNDSNASVCDDRERIRASMLAAHEAGLSWGKMAKLKGINKAVAYRFVMEGYIPKDPEILGALMGNHVSLLVQKAHRDDAGRFTHPAPSTSRD